MAAAEINANVRSFTSIGQAQASATCRLLDLAPELRNEIYERAFSCNGERIDLNRRQRNCFSPALLLTCRQVYQEAAALFRDTVYDHYTTKEFRITLHSKDTPYRTLRRIATRYKLQNISYLELNLVFGSHETPNPRRAWFTLQPDRVTWKFEPVRCAGTVRYYLPLKITNDGPATRELQGMGPAWRNHVVKHLLGRPNSPIQTNIQRQVEALLTTFSIPDRG
ncbi:uncharacterized protein MYCFIDRAFT_196410 [Pseudocercospora fijiensis CIRAD86]|uniref:Uncharacterized protein n=1 Tax=Pseudocercospora fijiensis (strain CIRAD86) TaxID=383855 RepID=M3AEI4_PSEFD|nr:uncharacterized protein MYCFIDRAFT_196410 [Pseudocercospora fijiensis CIRAD86]EME83011.1 hypothetical protein MYCFIDRAFT_196410 [Pseudocercospora fijiensis CIRAD86]